jgi:hypothetical protein
MMSAAFRTIKAFFLKPFGLYPSSPLIHEPAVSAVLCAVQRPEQGDAVNLKDLRHTADGLRSTVDHLPGHCRSSAGRG